MSHRDIKPANIVVTKDFSRAVLVDFNVAKKLDQDSDQLMYTSGAGTLAFAAPERLNKEKKGYTNKVDIWAAGILLVLILTGQHPFSENSGNTAKLII